MKNFVLLASLMSASASAFAAAPVIVSPERLAEYKALLPRVNDPALTAAFASSDTIFYDKQAIVPGYQDSMGDPKGMRPNTIQSFLIDVAVPGGHGFLFANRGRFNFPFGTGGVDNSNNANSFNFWIQPRQNGEILPVVYWRTSFSRWQWLFPVGTVLGEVLVTKFADGTQKTFEVRTRTRVIDGWEVDIYRPFVTSQSLADAIKTHRPDWSMSAPLANLVGHLEDKNTLTSRTLESRSYGKAFERVNGHQDILPEFDSPAFAAELLASTTFQSAKDQVWKAEGTKVAYAPTAQSLNSIVPNRYDGGMFPVNKASCDRCHRDAGRQIRNFHEDLAAYGEIWGEDETFSWHLFDNNMFVAANGDVKNFNDDNRRIRADFVAAGLVAPYNANKHPATIYKSIPRAWVYVPF